jgi:hypothetical protein
MMDAIEHGRTGLLVQDETELADAIQACDSIDPELCRSVARARFSDRAMIEAYFKLYTSLAHPGQARAAS